MSKLNYLSRTYATLDKYDGSKEQERAVEICETLFEEYDKQHPGTDHWNGPENEFQWDTVNFCENALSMVNGDNEELMNLAKDLMKYGF